MCTLLQEDIVYPLSFTMLKIRLYRIHGCVAFGWCRVPGAAATVCAEQGEVPQHDCRHSGGPVAAVGCDGLTTEMDGGRENPPQHLKHSTKRVFRNERRW